MKKIAFYLLYPILWGISVLPSTAAYGISNVLSFFIYCVVGYRKKVVYENLRRSFPEKNEKEIEKIAKGYYRHMGDLLVESFRSLTVDKKTALQRTHYPDTSLVGQFFKENRSVILVTAHYGNWEWVAVSLPLIMGFKPLIVYKPMTNTYFNDMFCKIRTRLGSDVVAMKNTMRAVLEYKDRPTALVLNADQSPGEDNAIWVDFFGRKTAFLNGTEKIARKFNYPVIYMEIAKAKRGQYDVIFHLISSTPKNTVDGEITQAFASLLEADIRKKPHIWLWSHRRWKLKPQEGL